MLIWIADQYRRLIDDPYHSTAGAAGAGAANKNQKNKRSAPDHSTAAVSLLLLAELFSSIIVDPKLLVIHEL